MRIIWVFKVDIRSTHLHCKIAFMKDLVYGLRTCANRLISLKK